VNEQLRDILVSDLPPAFVTQLRNAFETIYRTTYESVHNDPNLASSAKSYLLPHSRRAELESVLLRLAAEARLATEEHRVRSGAAEFVIVRSRRLSITCSRTPTRDCLPRKAVFREQYADVNQHIAQLSLIPVSSDPGESALYCVVAHGPNILDQRELGFLAFGFPNHEGTAWADEPVDIIDLIDLQRRKYQHVDDPLLEIQKVTPRLKPGVLDSKRENESKGDE